MDVQQTLDQLVLRAGDLYSLPAVAVEVLELTCRPEIDARRLKASIERDPALASKVLRVVNSSLFGLAQPIRDLGQALALLGIKPLKLLVLGFSLPEGLFANVAGEILAVYWRRTLTKAVAARELGESIWRIGGDEAFLVGLLQDLGQLVLIQEVGQPYAEFLATAQRRRGDLARLERDLLGFDHTQLTTRLLTSWKLPAPLAEACELPVTPEDRQSVLSTRASLPQVALLAELVARLLVDDRPGALEELLEAGRMLNRDLDRETLEGLAATIQDKVTQLAEVLSLEVASETDYRDVLNRAHRELAAVAADSVGELLRAQRGAPAPDADGLSMLTEMKSLSEAVARLTAQASLRTAARATIAPAPERTAQPDRGGAAVETRRQAKPALKVGEAAVLAQLGVAAAACRVARRPLSLLLVEIDHYESLAFEYGLERAAQWLDWLEALCRSVDHPQAVCLAAREACFALVLPEAERRTGVEIAGALARGVRSFVAGEPGQKPAVTVSVGEATVAAIAKNFAPGDLLEKAGRCLYGAQSAGGDSIKSIEIY